MRKVFILGSKGMAGHVIYTYLKEKAFDVVDLGRSTDHFEPAYSFDVTDFNLLRKAFVQEKPDFVINCIGVLNRTAEEHPDKAVLINTYLPHWIARTGTELSFKLIHISTDCVFSGKKGNYKVNDPKDGEGFYAQTKALGEVSYGNHLTIRTSIVGPELKEGIGLFHWFMKQQGTVSGYKRALWTGVTTLELAKAIESILTNNISGLHHLVNGNPISKYELLDLFKAEFHKNDVTLCANDSYSVDKSLVKSDVLTYQVPAYSKMISEMKTFMLQNRQMYTQYFSN